MNFKKILMTIFVITIVFACVNAFAYTDLDEKFPAYVEAINELSKKGVISGYPDDTFRGSLTVTRAEAIKMIVTGFDLKAKDGEPAKLFLDVKDTWSEKYVNIATSNKVIEGYEDGTFKPNNTITYGEISAIVARLKDLKLPEKEQDEAWYTQFWKAMEEADYFKDIATNDVIPVANARRDNVALIIYNALYYKKPIEKPETEKEEPKEETKEVTDFDTSKIYFGKVDTKPYVRGKGYIDVQNFNDVNWSLFLKDYAEVPEDGSVIFYKIRKSKSINLLKELNVEELKDAYIVEEIADDEDNIVILKDHEKKLSLVEDDEYTFAGSDINLDKLSYIRIDVSKNNRTGNIEFKSGAELNKEDAFLKKADRIIVEADKKLLIIVRGLSLTD